MAMLYQSPSYSEGCNNEIDLHYDVTMFIFSP